MNINDVEYVNLLIPIAQYINALKNDISSIFWTNLVNFYNKGKTFYQAWFQTWVKKTYKPLSVTVNEKRFPVTYTVDIRVYP